ncbi:UNVERIFIED_ORG: ribokinase [Arthrobacter sp. UYCu721]
MTQIDRTTKPLLAIIGSINIDTVTEVSTFPGPGQTVIGNGRRVSLGGKGANQAAAAAKLNANVSLVGAIGAEDEGRNLVGILTSAGVKTDQIAIIDGVATGHATITVDDHGENIIIVTPGANHSVDTMFIGNHLAVLHDAELVLMQGELLPETIVRVAEACAIVNRRFVLNLAPPLDLPEDILGLADPLIVNEHEARHLGFAPVGDESWETAISQAVGSRVKSIVVTLGSEGAVAADDQGVHRVAAQSVTAIDTTGAGDAFVGALAASLANGATLPVATQYGVRAGSHSVQFRGTVESYPSAQDLSYATSELV